MANSILQLIILFIVIFDPLVSLTVFFVATEDSTIEEKHLIAVYSVLVAGIISLFFLIFGQSMLYLFSTDIEYFRIAGGIILTILGINMVRGTSFIDEKKIQKSSGTAISSIIGSPILAGPAAITTIIISRYDNGLLVTGLSLVIVLLVTGLILYFGAVIRKYLSLAVIQVLSSILGLITVSWGVKFILVGLNYNLS